MSLDSRLSESPEVRDQISELLEDLYRAIQDVKTICSGKDIIGAPATDTVRSDDLELDDLGIEDEDRALTTEENVSLILDMMNECMKALFRIGILVRREVSYDRFQRALDRSKFAFPEQFDTDYVEHKHPKLKAGAGRGLAMRLGKANAKRRQFIKYGRDHKARLETEFHQETEFEGQAAPSIDLEALTEKMSSKATTFINPTGQWGAELFDPDPVEEDDTISMLTASTTFDPKDCLRLPSLADIGPGGKHFECPLCFTLQSFRKERAWKKHAYYDLKAYICTYGGKECDSEMFVDRGTWFDHELKSHRSHFACKICGEEMEGQEHLQNHVLSDHTKFPSGQLSTLMEQGQVAPTQLRAQDCPFCDDWAHSLSSKRHPAGETELRSNHTDIFVPLSKFKKHVATHQEQLAIFTVPKPVGHEGSDESGRHTESNVSINNSEESPAYSDASDAFVVEITDTSADVDSKSDIEVDKEPGESRPRVLVAEDNPINLAVLRRLLSHEGIQDIYSAKDGQEAYDIVKANVEQNDQFDLIFMDIQMPRLNGLASTRLIRELGYEAPIIAVTPASSDTSRAHELIQMGINEVILKPFRQPTIKKVLQKFGIASDGGGISNFALELNALDSYQTPTVDVENLISPLEAFLATASLDDLAESSGQDSNLHSVAALIAETLSGSGKVKTADLIDVLPNLHHNEIMNLRTEYKSLVKTGPERKGVNVAKHIRARLKDGDKRLMTAAYATALGMWESEGYWLWLSFTGDDGAYKGHQLLIESLFGRSNTEARLVKDGFRIHSNKLERERGTSLESFLGDFLHQGEDWLRDAVKAVLSGSRMEDWDHSGQPRPIDMQLVEKDVDDLFEALSGERGAATTVTQIVVLRSDAHLREVLTIYQRKYDSDFFTDALQGVVQLRDDVLFHVLYGALNRPVRDAWLLHRALTPRGDGSLQHELLISRLVRAHWNGHYLSAVKQTYNEQYGHSLVDDIAAGSSGEWGAFCLALAKSDLQWDERSG